MGVEVRNNLIFIHLDKKAAASIKFHLEGNRMYLDSTFTPEQYRGRGVGGELIQAAMRYAKDKGLLIVPACAFAVEYFKKHTEYADILYRG